MNQLPVIVAYVVVTPHLKNGQTLTMLLRLINPSSQVVTAQGHQSSTFSTDTRPWSYCYFWPRTGTSDGTTTPIPQGTQESSTAW